MRKTVFAVAALSLASLVSTQASARNENGQGNASEAGIAATMTLTAVAVKNTEGTTFCGGAPLDFIGEGHGVGFSPVLGPFTVFLQKGIDSPGPMHGCITLTSPDGADSVEFIFDGNEGNPDSSNFITDASGTMTVKSATGKFADLKISTLQAKAVFYVGQSPTVTAYYSIN